TSDLATFRVGRSFSYSASANGMTVFRPSLPPVNSTTTRIVSFAPFVAAAGAAMAVRFKKSGTVQPQLTNEPVPAEVLRKSRRVGFMILLRLTQLELRKRKN